MQDILEKARQIRLVIFDVDGVLTDGRLIYGAEGEALKQFHAHDGLGLVMARVAGVKRAVLTGRNSGIVGRRCRELRFDAVKLGRFDKTAALAEILAETGCEAAETLYMGDDLIDLPAIQRFEASDMVRTAFGAEVIEHYVHFARTEQRKFDEIVTCWERARFFERI